MGAVLMLLLVSGLIFVGCLLGAAMGALAGVIAGWVFDGSFVLLAQALGIPDAQPYQIGAMAGFIGSFFHSSTTSKE